jgi:hypothetical protein
MPHIAARLVSNANTTGDRRAMEIPTHGKRRVLYFDLDREVEDIVVFNRGQAVYGVGKAVVKEVWFEIDPYLHTALFELEIVDQFNNLPCKAEYGWGPSENPTLLLEGLGAAAAILRRTAKVLGEEPLDFLLLEEHTPAPGTEFRIRAEAHELRGKLYELAAFFEMARQSGSNVGFYL